MNNIKRFKITKNHVKNLYDKFKRCLKILSNNKSLKKQEIKKKTNKKNLI